MIAYCVECDSAPAWEAERCQACYQRRRRQRLKTAAWAPRCCVVGCSGQAAARGQCWKHYQRWRRQSKVA